ncbi:uncharacterized protein J4E87_009574 [Alternaria ethzedia]|uniref:uncharacterized protein n=1 Tax=Alternaria ethzedia TaxID=181014 RepID=UPI0020C23052|nr:uncharacterized protein J4E87_009574 [Alternaria ethzedia]KAI4614353.1 hypothetical protein J4E87_009574 [Alternaria ethzedia]
MEKCIEASERILAAAKSVTTASVSTQTALEGVEEASTVSTAGAPGGHAIVLVLIDGTSHQFLDELYRNKMSGGAETAKRLRDVVGERVAAILPAVARSGYHIFIKIFACLKTLSTRAAAAKLTSPEPRSLGFHFGEFSKVSSFFDFVDTGDEGHVPTKISGKVLFLHEISGADMPGVENFKFYMADPNCKHVFFAAVGSSLYRRALYPYRGQAKKVTLVRGTSNTGGLSELGFPVVTFGNVFSIPLIGQVQAGGTTQIDTTTESPMADTAAKARSTSNTSTSTSLIDVSGDLETVGATLYEGKLPSCYIDGHLPVNAAEQRIDIYVPKPPAAEIDIYKAHYKRDKLCNQHHLGNSCTIAKCRYYHGVLEPEAYRALQYQVIRHPCKKGGLCRSSNCFHGHVCQSEKCAVAGNKVRGCIMPASMHGMDLKVAGWVAPSNDKVKNKARLAAPTKMEDLRPFDDIGDLIDFD